jgi:hypothetical protein
MGFRNPFWRIEEKAENHTQYGINFITVRGWDAVYATNSCTSGPFFVQRRRKRTTLVVRAFRALGLGIFQKQGSQPQWARHCGFCKFHAVEHMNW